MGPIAVTSANPTGEADTTHHNQVYAKLGNKVMTVFQFKLQQTLVFVISIATNNAILLQVEGVLCDGPSPENIASTVVDCTKIETGHIGFFRVGLIPKSKVTHLHVLLKLSRKLSSSLFSHLCLMFVFVSRFFRSLRRFESGTHMGRQIMLSSMICI